MRAPGLVPAPAARCTSSRVMDPPGPLPASPARSTPSSRASLRTGGFASTLAWPPGAPLSLAGAVSATEPFPAGALRARRVVAPALTP